MLAFFDSAGGGLASLAASLAKHRGLDATAYTLALVAREEVPRALDEIGVAAQPATLVDSAPPGAIVLDPSGDIAAKLYDGPPETAFGDASLERIALARIARDTIERWLDASAAR